MEIKRCVNCMEEMEGSVCPHCGYQEESTEQISYGLKRNSILHGRYLIGNVLGQGGFGITYIGFDMALNIKVAIKEYFPMGYVSRDVTHSGQLVWNTSKDGQQQWKNGREGFLKEARSMAQIDVLPEIVRVRDTFMDNQTAYIVMDYVEGETLKSKLLNNGTMKLSDCVKLLFPLMNSLGEVHTRGIIHRDISPDNIMVLPDGKVRLLDLGAAKDLTIESNGASQLVTKKGFSPAEQYMDSGKTGTWTDVYALTATIYYCITGKMVPDAMERLMGDTLTFDVPMKEALSGEAVEILSEGLAVNAKDRIQTVPELAERLQKAVPDFGWTDPAPAPRPDPKPDKKKTVIGAVGILAVAVIVICICIAIKSGSDDNGDDEQVVVNSGAESDTYTDEMSETEVQSETMPGNTDQEDSYRENFYQENFLMEDKLDKEAFEEGGERWVLGKKGLARSSIITVTFWDTLRDMPEGAWDVSQEKNRSVMAWTKPAEQSPAGLEGCDLYIAAEGGMEAGSGYTLFACYENMTEINFNECFHTDQATSTYRMFYGCEKLKSIDMGMFETGNVTDMRTMFYGCSSLEDLDLSGFDTSQVINMRDMFNSCSNLKSLDLSSFDTGRVENMRGMFSLCSDLRQLDLSNFDTGKVTNMEQMFRGCTGLTELDLNNFNTSQVTNMNCMFYECRNIKELNLDSFITGRVTDMGSLFSECNCLQTLDINSFNTSQVINMRFMFNGCSALKELELGGFNTSQVTDMRAMFQHCSSLEHIFGIDQFDTSQVIDMGYMFFGCSSLEELDLGGFDMGSAMDSENMMGSASITAEEAGLSQ